MDSRLNAFLERADAVLARIEPLLPAPRQAIDWTHCLAARWQREGRSGFLLPLQVSLDMRLSDLIGVDRQVEQLGRNTRQFLDGLPANHALLWGSRGTGKSSLVRALLAEHAEAGLRLIEIERDHLADLPRVVEQIAKLPQRFVLFCDDLSFESGEGDYRVLKSVLDGSLEQAPDNVLLYATSNRRHLVPERKAITKTGNGSMVNCTPARQWKTRSPCRIASACGYHSIRSPRSTSWMWSNTGSVNWPTRQACRGNAPKSWTSLRCAGPRGGAIATDVARINLPAIGWG